MTQDHQSHRIAAGTRRPGGAGGRGHGRASRRRRHGPLRGPLPQGGDRRARRCAIAQARGAPHLSARTRRAPRRGAQSHRWPGQARCGARSRHPGRRQQGAARRPLPAVQVEAPHQGRHRPRGRARPLADLVLAQPGQEPERAAARFVDPDKAGRRYGRGAGGRPFDPDRAFRRGRRPRRLAARADVARRPPRVAAAQGQAGERRQVLRLFRFCRKPAQAALAPHPGLVPRRDRGGARPRAGARAGGGRAPGPQCVRDPHHEPFRRRRAQPARRPPG